MDYATVEALREFAGFETDKDDELLSALVSAASRAIDGYCGRAFAVDAETVHVFTKPSGSIDFLVDPFDGRVLWLDGDLAQVASAITGSPSVTYHPNLTPYDRIILAEGSWTSPISVTGYWAYSRVQPPDVEQVCLRLSNWLYELRHATRAQEFVTFSAEGTTLMPALLPADIRVLLAPYRKLRFAG